jgi:voltage-gated potassium channel Kch
MHAQPNENVILLWLSRKFSSEEPTSRRRAFALLGAVALALVGGPATDGLIAATRAHEPVVRFIRACGWTFRIGILFIAAIVPAEGIGVGEAAWQAWQTATTVGYGNMPAVSAAGRACVVVLGTINIGFVGYAISAAFELREYAEQLRKTGRMHNPKNQAYVILNSPGERDLKIFIRGVRSSEPDAPICVVDARIDALPAEIANLPDVHFVKGSPLNPAVLGRAGVERSRAVVIYALDKDQPDSDAATLTVARLLWRIPATFRINYFLVEPHNAHLFEEDFLDSAERGRPRPAAIPRHLATMAAVQAVRSSRVGETLSSLIRADNGYGFHAFRYAGEKPVSWKRLCRATLDAAERTGAAANAVSLTKAGEKETDACPKPSETVRPGDQVVLAWSEDSDPATFLSAMEKYLADDENA